MFILFSALGIMFLYLPLPSPSVSMASIAVTITPGLYLHWFLLLSKIL